MEFQRTKVSKKNLEKNQSWITTSVSKTMWYWHKDRYIDQWNKVESPEIDICGQLIFRHCQDNSMDERIVFSPNSIETYLCKKMTWESYFTKHNKNKLILLKVPSVRAKTIKFSEECK
jgi:hypothetical protein